jgi:hypothetical protein
MSRACVVTVICVVTILVGAPLLSVVLPPSYPVHAQSKDKKDDGVGVCRKSSSGPLCGDATAGKKIYENDGKDGKTHCILCHGKSGKGLSCPDGTRNQKDRICAPDFTTKPSVTKSPADLRKTFDTQADNGPASEGHDLDYGAKNDVMAYVMGCLRYPQLPCPQPLK